MRLIFLTIMIMVCSCTNIDKGNFTKEELDIIHNDGDILRVLSIDSKEDSLSLRQTSTELSEAAIVSEDFRTLKEKMIATVTHPSQDGVGIAGPQIGINRRVVVVQRFDKEGEPFEIYPNIRITSQEGEKIPGMEGCLSVPGKRGSVLRYPTITIEYQTVDNMIETVQETISGFTAVIFQHECDHLEGILYTDRASKIYNESTESE